MISRTVVIYSSSLRKSLLDTTVYVRAVNKRVSRNIVYIFTIKFKGIKRYGIFAEEFLYMYSLVFCQHGRIKQHTFIYKKYEKNNMIVLMTIASTLSTFLGFVIHFSILLKKKKFCYTLIFIVLYSRSSCEMCNIQLVYPHIICIIASSKGTFLCCCL